MFHLITRSRCDFNTFRRHLMELKQLSESARWWNQFPRFRKWAARRKSLISDVQLDQSIAIIDAMTVEERRQPYLIDVPHRRLRVALAAGVDQAEVLRTVEMFDGFASWVRQLSRMTFAAKTKFLFRQIGRELGIKDKNDSQVSRR